MSVIHTPKAGDLSADPTSSTALRTQRADQPTEVLFPEAKRRERHRRLIVLAIVFIVVGTSVAYALSRHDASPARRPGPRSPGALTQPSVTTAIGPLKAPYGLAIAPNGDLYVVDTVRDQVLRRLPTGKFQVVAGDGGPAAKAELSLDGGSAIAVTKDGRGC
jgi:hypothetical protein